ncbi:MAG: hypothetical protein IPL50_10350 [Chitinophagaceae bacterium]|nr:hypothetical protein [Chitinophagaceae bacterium]
MTAVCAGDKGTLFVGNRSKDKVYAVTDADKDGIADTVLLVIDKGLNMPNGVAFRNGSLYVTEVNRMLGMMISRTGSNPQTRSCE